MWVGCAINDGRNLLPCLLSHHVNYQATRQRSLSLATNGTTQGASHHSGARNIHTRVKTHTRASDSHTPTSWMVRALSFRRMNCSESVLAGKEAYIIYLVSHQSTTSVFLYIQLTLIFRGEKRKVKKEKAQYCARTNGAVPCQYPKYPGYAPRLPEMQRLVPFE